MNICQVDIIATSMVLLESEIGTLMDMCQLEGLKLLTDECGQENMF